MKMYTLLKDQGQVVEVSYGYGGDGTAYRRRHDRSDGSTTWEVGDLDWDLEPEGVSTERIPCVIEWVPCDPPAEEAE